MPIVTNQGGYDPNAIHDDEASEISAITEKTAPIAADLIVIEDSAAGNVKKMVQLGNMPPANPETYYGSNLIKNSPGQIVTDGAEPQWWDDVANAAITDEDAAGEGIADKTLRVFKVVTSANNVYGYQAFTFSDENLLDAGVTVISASCWVYCASASKASIGLYGTNLGLQESSQHTGDSTWQLLTVEAKTLNAADTSIQFRLIVDTGTAYFTMPMLNVGAKAMPWVPRGSRYVAVQPTAVYSAAGISDVAWTDADATAVSHALAFMLSLRVLCQETVISGNDTQVAVAHSDDIVGADDAVSSARPTQDAWWEETAPIVMCDDAQLFRYMVGETDADSDVTALIEVSGYWRWE